jgi:K+/H+ antiporter YhaU regulatory subunit KhtT
MYRFWEEEKVANKQAIYHNIALDIAKKIVNGDFPVGAKLSGRSLLSCQYSVSPETIRKSVSLLRDSAVVQVSQGKEITVLSPENAGHFIKSNSNVVSGLLQEELELVLAKKQQIDKQFEIMYSKTMSFSDKLKTMNALIPEEISFSDKSPIIGKSLDEIALWRHTGATLVAVRRGGELIVSPDPNTIIQANDRIFFVGPEGVYQKVADYLGQNEASTKVAGIGRLSTISALAIVLTESSYSAWNILLDPMCQTCLALLCECA